MLGLEKIALADACEYLECGDVKLLQLLNDGSIPGLKAGRGWVIPRAAFIDAVNALAVSAAKNIRDGILEAERQDEITRRHAGFAAAQLKSQHPGRARKQRTLD